MGSEVEKIVAVNFWTINDTLRKYVECECFFELLVVMVLSVSHLVAFIRVEAVCLFSFHIPKVIVKALLDIFVKLGPICDLLCREHAVSDVLMHSEWEGDGRNPYHQNWNNSKRAL